MNSNGGRFRVPVQAGQFYVIVNDWDGEVDGPHKQQRDSYRIAISGRRSVHVFDDPQLALHFAEAAVEKLAEEQGDL